MIILDTDHISMLQYRDSPQAFALQARLEALPEDVATTVITVEEHMRGRLGLIHRYTHVRQQVEYYDRLIGLFAFSPIGTFSRLMSVPPIRLSNSGSNVCVSALWISRSPRLPWCITLLCGRAI